MKTIRILLIIACAALPGLAATNDTSVLLAPIDASRIASYDWGVVTLDEPISAKGSTADRGSLRVNIDLVKFFQEGYAIYSITKIEKGTQSTPALLIVLVRPKGK